MKVLNITDNRVLNIAGRLIPAGKDIILTPDQYKDNQPRIDGYVKAKFAELVEIEAAKSSKAKAKKVEPKEEAKPEPKVEPKEEAKPEPKTEAAPEPEADPKEEVAPEPKTEEKAEEKPAPKEEAKAEKELTPQQRAAATRKANADKKKK